MGDVNMKGYVNEKVFSNESTYMEENRIYFCDRHNGDYACYEFGFHIFFGAVI